MPKTIDMVQMLASNGNASPAAWKKLTEALAEFMAESAVELDSIAVPGFGTFEPKKKLERIALNPTTGKRTLIPPKISITFRPSALLKQRIRDEKSKQ